VTSCGHPSTCLHGRALARRLLRMYFKYRREVCPLSLSYDDHKELVLAKLVDERFQSVYGDLENAKPSGDGWMQACCPFHEDKNPSFGFNPTTGQWNCFSGCGKGDVFDFLMKSRTLPFKEVLTGISSELGLDKPSGESGEGTAYSYCDMDGLLLFQVVRSPGKKFWQRRPDGAGGWIKNTRGVERVLYHLPELLSRPNEPVYIVEGEKDADRLTSLGLLTTTSPGGAGKWSQSYSQVLVGRDVVILPDNDAPGREHAARVARSLRGQAKSSLIIKLPDVPEKGDVSDWLDAGGDSAKLKALVAQAEPWSPSVAVADHDLPAIETYDRPLRDIYDEAWVAVLAVNNPPKVFSSAGHLARLRNMGHGPEIEFMNKEGATGLLARSADWIRTKGDRILNVKPVKEAADELITTPHSDLPKLDAVIHTPVFDNMWRLISEPGFHPEARLWFHLEADAARYNIPAEPTEEDVQAGLSLILDDLLVDFPFIADSDRAHAVAALLLPFARRMFTGPTPIHLLEAPVAGTGKSLLAELISIIALGVIPGVTTLDNSEEETRKKLTAILSRGASVISIDNKKGRLASSQVAAAVTTEYWEDRLLGKTQIVRYPNQALWLVSGNNPSLSMEIARRCVRIRMDAGMEHPWEDRGQEFKHADIRGWAKTNRHDLVQAVLTLITHWIVSGAPTSSKSLGSFENWASVIGGMIEHFGLPDFLQDPENFYEAADPESGEWSAFILAWWEVHSDVAVTARDLHQLAVEKDMVGFAYAAQSEQLQRTRFGRSLSGLRDRRFGNHQVIVGKDSHKKVRTFRLVPVEKGLVT
jgi:CHC2 zinc finger